MGEDGTVQTASSIDWYSQNFIFIASDVIQFQSADSPEPSTALLMLAGLGLSGISFIRRRRASPGSFLHPAEGFAMGLLQQHFQHTSFGGAGEGLRGFGQGEAGGDEVLDGDKVAGEQGKRGFKSAAPRTYQGELVDDDGGGIHWDGAMHGRFQNHGAAGTGHGGGGAQPFGAAGGVHHPVVTRRWGPRPRRSPWPRRLGQRWRVWRRGDRIGGRGSRGR